jgi:hypothetical protein
MAAVFSVVKWFTASFVVSWQTVQAMFLPTWSVCLPELKLLYWAVPEAWQDVHWVFTFMLPVIQLGVVCPPWQLTFEQAFAALLNDDAPDSAL